METKELKKNKGITLIALVITIIVLLILAGVTIATLTGENGILTKAIESKEKTLEGQVKEKIELMNADYLAGTHIGEEENIKEYYQKQAANGEISSIRDNKDNTYTISDDGFEIKIDESGNIIEVKDKEEKPLTEGIWYKIEGTTAYIRNNEMEGYSKSAYDGRDVPEWASFRGESPIEKVVIETEIVLQDIKYWFCNCTKLTEIEGIEKLDTSNVTSMNNLFYNCKSLTDLDLSHFDTSNVTNMSWMFNGCNSLINLDVSSFDTSNVTTMELMFIYCRSLTNLDVTNFNTKNVNNMWNMFSYMSSLTELDLRNFNTSKISNSRDMLVNVICPVYVGSKWSLTEEETGYTVEGGFIR